MPIFKSFYKLSGLNGSPSQKDLTGKGENQVTLHKHNASFVYYTRVLADPHCSASHPAHLTDEAAETSPRHLLVRSELRVLLPLGSALVPEMQLVS